MKNVSKLAQTCSIINIVSLLQPITSRRVCYIKYDVTHAKAEIIKCSIYPAHYYAEYFAKTLQVFCSIYYIILSLCRRLNDLACP